jgi:hypothetical protein
LLVAAMLQIGETPELRNLLVKYDNCLHCDEVMMVEPEEEEEVSCGSSSSYDNTLCQKNLKMFQH